jgi:xanthine dehydrogenase accessory factor
VENVEASVMEDPKRLLADWWDAGHTVAVATVCDTWQSAPRVPGSIMVLGPDGEVTGSVSGGCVEGAVYESCVDAVATGRARLEHYGVSDEDAFSVGLTCGGEIDVFVEPVSPEVYPELGEALNTEHPPVAVATVIAHELPARVGRHLVIHESSVLGSLGSEALDEAVALEARARAGEGKSTVVAFQRDEVAGEPAARVFLSVEAIPARLLVFGATDLTAAVATLGTFAGYHVTVCDARPAFATPGRFHDAAEVINEWPHRYLAREAAGGRIDERTALAVLTHDPKFDTPVLQVALGMPVGYIGLLGSRRTCEDRRRRLVDAGVPQEQLDRLRAPIGLDIGGRSVQEMAISILAEIIAARSDRTGAPLSSVTSPIHR